MIDINLVKGCCLSISALQEAAVGMFTLEVREVFGDPHIKPIQSGQNKLWPGKGHKSTFQLAYQIAELNFFYPGV